MDGHTLTNSFINWVFNIQLLQSVVTGVKYRENTDDTVVINFVVSKVQGKELVMGEQKLCHHHGTISLDLVHIQIQIL